MIRVGAACRRSNLYQRARPIFGRSVSTDGRGSYDPAKVRNIAVVAHIDSGKTTLTESILARSGYLTTPGTVDTGSTTTDFLPAERERGITIQSASIPVTWKEWSFNLIDTPGHADFGMEVESASRVVDGAVVLIDSVEGVESQTQGVWNQLNRYGVPSRVLFLNKMDRTGSSFRASVQSLLNYRLHPKPMVLTLPVASFDPRSYASAEPGIEGLVDLVRWELWKWENQGSEGEASFTRTRLPSTASELEKSNILPAGHPLMKELVPSRMTLLENLSMFSEELMDELLSLDASSYISLDAARIIPALRSATLRNDVLPVLCGSATKHIGTDLVLDYAGLLLASPLDAVNSLSTTSSDNLQMLAWKVTWDKRRGWMTFVRIYSGSLTRQTTLYNVSRGQKERLSKLMLFYASETEEVDVLRFGSVGVVLGLKHTRTGDTLVAYNSPEAINWTKGNQQAESHSLRTITPPAAVMSSSIVPLSNSDLEPVKDAIISLTRTDPSARLEVSEGQLLVHGLGALHLEIIEGRLRDDWNVAFEAGRRRVSYRESFSPGTEMSVKDEWDTEVHGRSTKVEMEFSVRALEAGENGDALWADNLVVDAEGRQIPPAPDESMTSGKEANNPRNDIARGISSALLSSPNSGLPFSHTRVELRRFELSPQNATTGVLAGAASVILRRAFQRSGLGSLMEPYVCLMIIVNEEHIGRLIKDLTESGGEVMNFADQGSEPTDEVGVPYPADSVYLPPEWMTPSASTSQKAGNIGSNMKRVVHAVAPLSQMLDFNTRLRALSGGHGTFEMSNAGFRAVNGIRKVEILKELGRA